MKKSTFWKGLRTLISFLVAFFLIRFVVVSTGVDLRQVWKLVDAPSMGLAFTLYGVGFFVASYRWYFLLHHIQVKLPFWVVVRLALIGQFFNLFVPGGVGGDLIKMVYLRKEAGGRFPEAVLTVLLDRLLGLAGLLLLGLVAVGLNPSMLLHSSPQMRAILAVVALGGGIGLLGALLFLLWPYLSALAGPFQRMRERLPEVANGILARILEALALLRSAPTVVLKLLSLAMLGHLFATFAVWVVGTSVGGVSDVSFQEFLLATQLSNLVGAVPLTPGGLGGRDLCLSYLLGLSGAGEEARGAIPLVVTSLIILWSSVGGFALLWEKQRLQEAPGEEES